MALSTEESQKLAAIGFMTDGNIYYRKFENKYLLRFFSCDQAMHDYFQNLIRFAFNENPSAFTKHKSKKLWTTEYHRGVNNQMVRTLLSFSDDYCTSKWHFPSLQFLFDEKEELKIKALRFAMSCDGSVSIKKGRSGKSFSLRLACANPGLIADFQKMFQDIGICMKIDRDKSTWSGFHGLCSTANDSFIRFDKIRGFLPEDVKVTNGKFVGLRKNKVLKNIISQIKHKTKPAKELLKIEPGQ